MFKRSILAAAFVLSVALTGGTADADAPGTKPMPAPEPASMESYGTANPSCLEWTNACRICQRGPDDKIACSTAGIACQPGGMVCKSLKK